VGKRRTFRNAKAKKKGLLAVRINKNIIDDLFYPEEEEKKVMRMCWKT
jgi:hypothetical protein